MVRTSCQVGAEDVKRLKSLEGSVAAAEKELKKVQGGASGLQARAEKVQEQIDNVGGEPLKKRKAKVASLQEVTSTSSILTRWRCLTQPVQPTSSSPDSRRV